MNTPSLPRLHKHVADLGYCSRRKAEELIEAGLIMVNGTTAQIGQRVDPQHDRISIDGKVLRAQSPASVTLVMNKPKGVLCSNHDPYHAETVFNLLPKPYREMRLYCAGRLDKDSQGMLILTNDGDLANRITHPGGGVIKRYRVTLHRDFDTALIPRLLAGVTREGEHLQAKKIIPASKGQNPARRVEVHLEQGRKREIRRLFEAFGYFVKKLERFQMGGLAMKGLAPGAARPLQNRELQSLFKYPKK